MELFTDNWGDVPTLYDGERLCRVITDNPYDNLYVVRPAGMHGTEFDEEVRWALIRKYGKRGKAIMFGIEDVTDLYYGEE